jgi:hypothetical protein
VPPAAKEPFAKGSLESPKPLKREMNKKREVTFA